MRSDAIVLRALAPRDHRAVAKLYRATFPAEPARTQAFWHRLRRVHGLVARSGEELAGFITWGPLGQGHRDALEGELMRAMVHAACGGGIEAELEHEAYPELGGDELYISELAVAEPHRRRGVARALLHRVLVHAELVGADLVLVDSWAGGAGDATYRSMGFGRVLFRPHHHTDGSGSTLMVRTLEHPPEGDPR